MSVQMELKRTYLARYIPAQVGGAEKEELIDHYIPEAEDYAHLRIRKSNDFYSISKKEQSDDGVDSQRAEHSVPLSAEEYRNLKSLTRKRLRRHRYHTTFYGKVMDVDVFQEHLEGLVLISFKFSSREFMQAFEAPEVCGHEVTGNVLSAGGFLAGKSLDDIIYDLRQLEYKPQFMEKEGS